MDTPTILVVNPNTSEDMTAAIDRVGQVAAGTSATVVTLRSQQGPHTIEGPLDAALGVAGMLEVIGAYTQPFDAVVVACFGDPGVDALRVLVRVPVIGIAAASFIQAAFLSQRFAIVTPAVRHARTLRCRDRRHGDKAAVSRYLSDTTVRGGF